MNEIIASFFVVELEKNSFFFNQMKAPNGKIAVVNEALFNLIKFFESHNAAQQQQNLS